MARLVTTGFEWNTPNVVGPDGDSVSSQTIGTTDARSGTYSLDVGSTRFNLTGVSGRSYYARTYFKWRTTFVSSSAVIAFRSSTVVLFAATFDATAGTFVLLGPSSVQIGSASSALTAGTYYRVELFVNINTTASAADSAELRIDGVTIASTSGTDLTSIVFDNVTFAAAAGNASLDDVAINDDQGASQNSWPGSGKVVLLKPISDSAVGTGWTLGTGTAISGGSGSTAVKNTPPVGVADLTAGSDTKQIRNATSNANVNYDANLTTYTNAGLGASDTVNVLVPMVATGAPVVTSAKAGTFGVSANPAITNVALGAGGTAGAFWSGVAAGTYPTGWKWSFGTTAYAPTVTVGSSPVARITQVTASTRIADVCAMGMYVDYTPAVALVFNASEGEEHSDPRSLQIMDRVSVVRGSFF